jgi:hypothetical protein
MDQSPVSLTLSGNLTISSTGRLDIGTTGNLGLGTLACDSLLAACRTLSLCGARWGGQSLARRHSGFSAVGCVVGWAGCAVPAGIGRALFRAEGLRLEAPGPLSTLPRRRPSSSKNRLALFRLTERRPPQPSRALRSIDQLGRRARGFPSSARRKHHFRDDLY